MGCNIKNAVNGSKTVNLRPFTVRIHNKTTHRILPVKLQKTAKYDTDTIRCVLLRHIIRSNTDRQQTVLTSSTVVNTPFLQYLQSVFGS